MISDITFFLFLNKNMVHIYFCVSTHPSRSSPQLMVRPGWFQALATKELRGPSKNAWTDDFGLFSGLDLPVSYVSCRKCIFFLESQHLQLCRQVGQGQPERWTWWEQASENPWNWSCVCHWNIDGFWFYFVLYCRNSFRPTGIQWDEHWVLKVAFASSVVWVIDAL